MIINDDILKDDISIVLKALEELRRVTENEAIQQKLNEVFKRGVEQRNLEKELELFFNELFREQGWRFFFAGPQSFPDLVVEDETSRKTLFGLEIKRSKSEQQIPGNSINSRPAQGLRFWQILLLSFEYNDSEELGIQLVKTDVRFYFDAVTGIRITHSPRFFISLSGKSLIEEIYGSSIEELLRSNKDELIKLLMGFEHLLEAPEELIRVAKGSFQKWIQEEVRRALNGIVDYDELESQEKKRYIARSIIYAPACIGKKRKEVFKRLARWLGFVPPSNLRDIFSAGGRVSGCPRVIKVLGEFREDLVKEWVSILLNKKQKQDLLEFWAKNNVIKNEQKRSLAVYELLAFWKLAIIETFKESYPNEDPKCEEVLKGVLEDVVREVLSQIPNAAGQ